VALARQGAEIVLSVADTGCGIPEKEQGKIFGKSFRAENAKKINFDGTGLGLYMVNTVVEKIGARVWFVSEENKGTTFFVAFPTDSQE
jgi:two-component system sensor histidine kinase VicK